MAINNRKSERANGSFLRLFAAVVTEADKPSNWRVGQRLARASALGHDFLIAQRENACDDCREKSPQTPDPNRAGDYVESTCDVIVQRPYPTGP